MIRILKKHEKLIMKYRITDLKIMEKGQSKNQTGQRRSVSDKAIFGVDGAQPKCGDYKKMS